jgi:integrase
MARTIKDTKLDKREARRRLEPRGKPYYRLVEEGLHLGYRKPNGRKGKPAAGGKWVTRIYIGNQSYRVENIDGVADDSTDADGVAVLNFKQAQDKARARFQQSAHAEAGMSGPLTVADAMADYLEALNHGGKSTYDAQKRADAFIIPTLGKIECSQIKAKALRNWLSALADKPPRVRTKAGNKEHQHRADFDPDDDEAKRKRRASANRVLATLRAALNHAFREGRVSSDAEWRRVKPFEQVDPTQIRFLSLAESKRLINAADDDFRPLVEAALLSGCRYGELCRLQVADFNVDAGALSIRKSKSGKPRTVYLTPEGIQLFQTLALGRTGRDLLLRHHEDGRAWGRSEQHRPMIEACERAKIVPHYTFHELRHTYGSLLAMAGVPMKVIAESMGHATTAMTEKHYAALAPSHVAETIRRHLPKFGTQRSNVVGLR